MILDLLDTDLQRSSTSVLADLIEEEVASLRRGNGESEKASSASGASATDGENAKGELKEWRKDVEALAGVPPTGNRHPIHIPRHPVGSLILANFDDFFQDEGHTIEQSGRGFAREETPISTIMLTDEARAFLSDTKRRRFWPKFGQRDARFLTWGAIAKISTRAKRGPHSFNSSPPPTIQMSDTARLILAGDWGSGIPRAQKVGTAMRTFVQESMRNSQDCHVIHLGDVYYCGWENEYKKRLLNQGMWPVFDDDRDRVSSWCLNGNHDMYSGGWDYFNYVLGDPRFDRQQKRSFFVLENSRWQVAGLDTAYADGDLYGPQVAWLSQLRHQSGGRKALLLSHHQLFSRYEKFSALIEERMKPILEAGLITAWFWGHEHLCAAYEPTAGVQFPRVVGHSGVPVYAWAGNPPRGVIWESPGTLTQAVTGWEFGVFGFAVLDFQRDGTIQVRYVDEYGTTSHTEQMG